MTEPPTSRQILDLPMQGDDDAGEATVRDYLVRLLSDLWHHRSSFNAKRPFGGSNWQWIIYEHLVKAGWVEGKLDEDGYIEDADIPAADRMIDAAIQSLGSMANGPELRETT